MQLHELNAHGSFWRVLGVGAIATCAAIAVGSTFGAISAQGSGDPNVEEASLPNGTTTGIMPKEVISLLGEAPSSRLAINIDAPTTEEMVEHGVDGISQDDLRYLGEGKGGQFWAATDAAGNICVITSLEGVDIFASACTTPEQVEEDGVWLSAFNDSESDDYVNVTAMLLPDSAKQTVALAARADTPWVTVAPNLVVAASDDLDRSETYSFNPSSDSRSAVELQLE